MHFADSKPDAVSVFHISRNARVVTDLTRLAAAVKHLLQVPSFVFQIRVRLESDGQCETWSLQYRGYRENGGKEKTSSTNCNRGAWQNWCENDAQSDVIWLRRPQTFVNQGIYLHYTVNPIHLCHNKVSLSFFNSKATKPAKRCYETKVLTENKQRNSCVWVLCLLKFVQNLKILQRYEMSRRNQLGRQEVHTNQGST